MHIQPRIVERKPCQTCDRQTFFVNKSYQPMCGAHLHEDDRLVRMVECTLDESLNLKYRVLRETTIRDERLVFPEKIHCTVCLSIVRVNTGVQTTCGHGFHLDCLLSWVHRTPNCPNCRTELMLLTHEDKFSVMDLVEPAELREKIRDAVWSSEALYERVHDYDTALEIAQMFQNLM
jgi:hypothetical protein